MNININIKQRIQPLKEKFLGWWGTLSQRDQLILKIAAPVVAVLLIYTLIWSPLHDGATNAKQRATNSAELLVWMQDRLVMINRLQQRAVEAGSLAGQPLLSAVDASTRSDSLAPYVAEVAQAGEEAVRVRFTEVPFDELIMWLERLWRELGVSVDQAAIDRQEETGLVDARVTLVAE